MQQLYSSESESFALLGCMSDPSWLASFWNRLLWLPGGLRYRCPLRHERHCGPVLPAQPRVQRPESKRERDLTAAIEAVRSRSPSDTVPPKTGGDDNQIFFDSTRI